MALRKQRAVACPSPDIDAAAEEVLRKGNAVDAAIAAVFAAAALSPGVLLGPVQLLVGGGGAGLRAFDGRVRQPGIGAPRPRGFTSDEEIPSSARIGVPLANARRSASSSASASGRPSASLRPRSRSPSRPGMRCSEACARARSASTRWVALDIDDLVVDRC